MLPCVPPAAWLHLPPRARLLFSDPFAELPSHVVALHAHSLPRREVLNEIESEHAMSPKTYTQVYDAIVAGIKRWAPNGSKNMKFMALALEGSGNSQYVSYVLNASNHAAGIPLPDFVSFHHYASASARNGGDAVGTAYGDFFTSGDQWLGQVSTIIAIRDQLSPSTMLDADEVGVILPDDNDGIWTSAAPGFPNFYWNAAAASYAYLFGITAMVGLDVLVSGWRTACVAAAAVRRGLCRLVDRRVAVSL